MTHHPVAIIGDVVSGVAVIGTLLGYLPDIAAGLAIVWYVIHFVESNTGRRIIQFVKGIFPK